MKSYGLRDTWSGEAYVKLELTPLRYVSPSSCGGLQYIVVVFSIRMQQQCAELVCSSSMEYRIQFQDIVVVCSSSKQQQQYIVRSSSTQQQYVVAVSRSSMQQQYVVVVCCSSMQQQQVVVVCRNSIQWYYVVECGRM